MVEHSSQILASEETATSTVVVVCFSSSSSTNLPLVSANRETAVVQALVTSGVMYVVARNCSTGALLSCTCDTHLRDNQTGKQALGDLSALGRNFHYR